VERVLAPGTLDRNTAITAMTLADTAAEYDLQPGHRLWPHIQSWAAELGLTAPDALARASEPFEKTGGEPHAKDGCCMVVLEPEAGQ
jgi:hypothetical protein